MYRAVVIDALLSSVFSCGYRGLDVHASQVDQLRKDMINAEGIELVEPLDRESYRPHSLLQDRMGMEQKTLADLVGVTANSVSNWENGRSRPDVNLLPAICNALNITLYDLFSMDDPTVKYSARQQMLVDEFSVLSEGIRKP